jgi:hypothetical protein
LFSSFTGENNTYDLHIFVQIVKGRKLISKTFKKRIQNNENYIICKTFFKNRWGGVKTAVGSELSLVSGTYHENKVTNKVSVVMEQVLQSLYSSLAQCSTVAHTGQPFSVETCTFSVQMCCYSMEIKLLRRILPLFCHGKPFLRTNMQFLRGNTHLLRGNTQLFCGNTAASPRKRIAFM